MKIFTIDIETSPHDAWAFNVWQTNILPCHLKEPTTILSFAGKFTDSNKVYYKTCFDGDMYQTLARLLDEADVVITYNGDKFDIKHINREFVTRGIRPARPFASIDLLKVVKQNFNFPHNRLDYICSVLLGEKKLDTGGFDLWPEFMSQNPKALRTMQRYNIKDTRLTEKLYLFLRPWIKNHPYAGGASLTIDDDLQTYECPACGSLDVVKDRPRRTRCFAIRVCQCNSCGTWFDGRRRKLQ